LRKPPFLTGPDLAAHIHIATGYVRAKKWYTPSQVEPADADGGGRAHLALDSAQTRHSGRVNMPREIKEADLKVLRRLHPLALERFCERVLAEIESVKHDDARSFHQRYLDIFEIVERRDREMARIFDNPKRSNALTMLALMRSQGLLMEDEYFSLSPETRGAIELLQGARVK
jgi:hypothetical protein